MPEPALRFLTLGADLTNEEQSLLETVHETLGRLTKRRKSHLSISDGLDAVLREVILYRIVAMASGTIVNWNTSNVLCSFLSARALFETFAFLWDYDRAISEGRNAGTLDEFKKLTINRLGATRNPTRLKQNPEWGSTNILTAINRLSEQHPGAKNAYDVMSYRCHPNTEGMFETFTDLDADTETVKFSEYNETARWAFGFILAITHLITEAEKLLNKLEEATPQITEDIRNRAFEELVAKSNREQEQFEQFGEDERKAFLGDARGQFAIGRAFSKGAPMVLKDLVRAYFWLSLAAAQGIREAAHYRDRVGHQMTPEQTSESQSLAAEWQPMTPAAIDFAGAANEIIGVGARGEYCGIGHDKKGKRASQEN